MAALGKLYLAGHVAILAGIHKSAEIVTRVRYRGINMLHTFVAQGYLRAYEQMLQLQDICYQHIK